MSKIKQTYGSWPSSIQAKQLISGQINPSQLQAHGDSIYWLEPRPEQKGRSVLVRYTRHSAKIEKDILPSDKSVRSRVHEYGGSSFKVCDRGIIFVNQANQQLYIMMNDGTCRSITKLNDCRFVDIQTTSNNLFLVCVCEQHLETEKEPINTLVSINIDTGKLNTLAQGEDFYASPAINHDQQLCWISWSHPDMPWDNTRLWIADISEDGTLNNTQCLRDTPNESIFQPLWSPDGDLYFVSDINGWWNIYNINNTRSPIIDMPAEFGLPQWIFGMSTYDFIDNNTISCSYIENGLGKLATINIANKTLSTIDTKLDSFDQIKTTDNTIWFVGSNTEKFPAIYSYDCINRELSAIDTEDRWQPESITISHAEAIHFDTSDSQQAHAFFYPPVNPGYSGTDKELPPLIVISHGGPTAFSDNSLSLKIQFWTSRGFAVCDVNYRGSTGYGRPYRDALKGRWGIADVDDCIFAARYLVTQNKVAKDKLIIRGSSAGGYSVLCALTYHNDFKAGASYYGISDLSVLAEDTHKFEARYLDRLVGPWPEAKQIYTDRSPINAVDQLNCPVIFFQGLQDKVVPPNQAENMVEALKQKGLPVAHVTYAEEQHGFRQAETIKHSLQTELEFYGKVFGFTPAEPEEKVSDTEGISSKFYNQD